MSNWPGPARPAPVAYGPIHDGPIHGGTIHNGPLPAGPGYGETWIQLPVEHRCSTAHLVVAWLGTVLTAGYLLPWAIGASRNRSNSVAIALVNIFLGWTMVGWLVALVMACGSEPVRPVLVRTGPPFPYVPYPYPPGFSTAAAPPIATPRALAPAPTPTYPAWPAPTDRAEATMPLPAFDPRRADLR